MTTFICGQGAGAEGVLEHVTTIGYKVQVFSHPGEAGRRMLERSALAGMPGTFASVMIANDPAGNLEPVIGCIEVRRAQMAWLEAAVRE